MRIGHFSKNKKASVVDALTAAIALFILALIGLCLTWVINEVQPELNETITNNESNAVMNDFMDRTPTSFDSTWIVIFVLFWIGAVILAFFVDSHPVFFTFSLILIIIVLVIGGYLANLYDEFNTDLGVGSSFPMTTYVMGHLIQFLLGIIVSILTALFAKSQWG